MEEKNKGEDISEGKTKKESKSAKQKER